MDSLAEFGKIAEYLKHPLILTGFVLLLFFGMVNKLIKAGILKLNENDSGKIVVVFLRYGFWLAILVVLLGFGLQFYQSNRSNDVVIQHSKTAEAVNINAIVQTLTAKSQLDAQAKDEQIKALTAAVTALSQGKGVIGTESQIQAAMAALAKNDTTKAKELFKQEAQKVELATKLGAKAYRNLGALAFLDNTKEALTAYRRATELDPDNADGWNELGLLLHRVGELDEAITAYSKVLALGETHKNQEEIAWAYGNLGLVYYTHGDLDKAIEFHQKSLAITEKLGEKAKMAAAYTNLGVVYLTRGNLDKAISFYQKSLTLNEALGRKEGMASNYGNLGSIYYKRGDLDKALFFYQKSLTFNEALGSKEGMALNYGNLGIIYFTHGELDKAIAFHQKSLAIKEALGMKEGGANTYANLGAIYEQKGNTAEAKHYWQKSIELYKQLGSPMAKTVQGWLDALP